MSDSPTPLDARPEADEAALATQEVAAARPRQVGRRRTAIARLTRRGFAIAIAVLATAVVALFTVDLARLYPGIVSLAEENASRYLERPMHIGRISAMLTPGRFAIDDVVIEGRDPGDRPFFTARRIYVHVPLWRIALGQIDIELEIDDWRMVVESWEGNRNNLPRLTPRRPQTSGPKRFNTTVRFAYARNGHFTYEDHATPWSVVAPNLNFSLVRAYNLKQYVGLLRFSEGSTQIQRFLPMRTDMSTRFVLNGGNVHLQHLDLLTDGAVSHVTGDVDFGRWPDQVYSIRSTVDFHRMRELFFANERWRLSGEGEFNGVFQYTRDGKRDLTGNFTSELAGVNGLEFRDLHGSLEWTRQRFVVHHADAMLFGGETRLQYGLAPLGTRTGATATFSATYRDVDLFDVDRLVDLRGLRLRGLATGTLAMQWPNGRFATGRRGEGHTVVAPFGDVPLATATLPDEPRPIATEPQPFDGQPRESTLTFGSDVHYQFDPDGTTFDRSWAATPFTFIEFNGRMAPGGAATFPFHVTSHDWQESDRLLAAIMTAVSGPTGAVEVGGRGRFDGQMTGTFSSPRVTGRFDGEGTRAWGVTWGRALADIVIEGGYVTISNSRIGDRADATIVPDGRFALGFRKDGREELEAKVTFANWPMRDLKTAFQLDDWSMDGTVGSAALNLRGHYRNMFGNGQVRIDRGIAWGEAFESARADVELEGGGMLLRRLEMRKGPGVIRGSARIGWDGTYAFNAEGVAIPVELLDNFKTPRAPLTGRLDFNASGAGPFESPVYTFDGSIQDLFVGDEGIGAVTGRLTVANDILTVERLLATSSRLVARASGTVAFDDVWTSNLDVRFQETSLDPYLKFVLTDDVSPYTRIVVAGSLAVRGPLGDPLAIRASTTVDAATLTLYDYDLTNDGPIQLTFDQGALKIGSFRLQGADTSLALTGGASPKARTFDLAATGNASLAILQLFYKSVAASGAATLNASLSGTFDDPRLTGAATIADGRLRPLDSPHSLEAINGNISFGGSGVRLDGLRGRIGTGDVAFGGNISLDGYRPDQFNLTASGRSMRLRYPEGFNSTVDMDLFLTGPLSGPRLSGNIDVLRLSYIGQASPDGGLLGLPGAAAGDGLPSVPAVVNSPATPLVLDIQVTAPRTSFVNTRTARIEGQADLQVRGTFDRPQILGTVDILGGEYIFNGNRYFVREGSVDFTNPDQPDPVFNVSAETRARVTGQTFTVNVRLTGTLAALNVNLTSDPWLPESDIVTLLFGGTPNWGAAEQRALVSSQELQQRMFQTAGATLLTSALTERVGDVFERTGALDTIQITPLLTNQTAFQQLDPSARITLGKRISPRLFLTYSRSFDTKQEEIILLEYDQNDRLSWVLSRNEDRTYALDFRLRYVF